MEDITKTDLWIMNARSTSERYRKECVKQLREDENRRIAKRRIKKFQLKNRNTLRGC